ncbi:MAG: GNAT family N-acetyltransferase [Lentisphaeria bacterium]|nr:GNAT family N-acetyltransferase [Lentisphaeria bacterium]
MTIRIVSDLDECARLWRLVEGSRSLFQNWDVRACFQAAFGHRPRFVVAERSERVVGLLPLSRIPGPCGYAFFPGELWQGKTWLERNRALAADETILRELFASLDAPALVRYLEGDCLPPGRGPAAEDETGYLFHPAVFNFDFAAYQTTLPGRTLRKFQKEIGKLEEEGIEFRYNQTADIARMIDMNLTAFGDYSYFRDIRFLRGFEQLVALLQRRGALLTTTVLIGGRPAAIDLGALWNNAYTVLAGGVDRSFPGVAKLINFHHLEQACRHRFAEVDFLCGDFGWKERFRLSPRILYKLSSDPHADTLFTTGENREPA